MEGVAVSGFDIRVVLIFLLISDFGNIMKGKQVDKKKWLCSHIETPRAVESHG